MKKFLIGFMFIMMIILPNYNVNAEEHPRTFEVDGLTLTIPDNPSGFTDYVLIYNDDEGFYPGYYVIFYNGSEFYPRFYNYFSWISGNECAFGINSSSSNDYKAYRTEGLTTTWKSTSGGFWTNGREDDVSKIIYSTTPIYFDFVQGSCPIYDVEGVESRVYTEEDNNKQIYPIKTNLIISKHFLGELLKSYLITFNFADFYNQDYKYRYKTDEIGFVDITDKVHSSENHTYPFTLAYNTEITVQVLDSEDNVVYEETDTTTEALDISTFSLKQAYSSASIGGLEQVTFELDWDDYGFAKLNQGVPLKLELDYGSNDLDPAKTPNLLSYRVLAYSETNSLLDINLLDYFDFYGGTTKKYYEEDYEKFSRFVFTTLKGLPEEVAKIKIIFNFDNLDNYYIYAYEYYNSGGVWDKVTTDTKGYTKYTFPEGYSRAIIRSKSFTNLQSSIITDFFYLNSGNFKLHSYDFTNRKVVKKDYKFSEYYLNEYLVKLPVDIDETNNVFPIIVKQTQCGVSGYYLHTDLSYKGFLKWFYITDSYDDYFTPIYSHCSDNPYFYLKDDLFVQFIHDDDLPNVIGGIDKDTFDENNDVIIWDSFINDTDQFTKDDNLVISDSVSGKVEEFFKDTGEYIKQIIGVPFYFLSKLNPWIERSIIIMFWCLIITRVVKVMRK